MKEHLWNRKGSVADTYVRDFLMSTALLAGGYFSYFKIFEFCNLQISDWPCQILTTFVLFAFAFPLFRTLDNTFGRPKVVNPYLLGSRKKQRKILSKESLPSAKSLDISMLMTEGAETGGDFYKFVNLEDEKIGIMVGEALDGIPKGIYLLMRIMEGFASCAASSSDPADVFTKLNQWLAQNQSSKFATAVYVIFDLKKRSLSMATARHQPLLVVTGNGQTELLNAQEGMHIGVVGGQPFNVFERPITKGEVFVFYTNGVISAKDQDSKVYGTERLQKKIVEIAKESASDIIIQAVSDVRRFTGKKEQDDDITMITVKIV